MGHKHLSLLKKWWSNFLKQLGLAIKDNRIAEWACFQRVTLCGSKFLNKPILLEKNRKQSLISDESCFTCAPLRILPFPFCPISRYCSCLLASHLGVNYNAFNIGWMGVEVAVYEGSLRTFVTDQCHVFRQRRGLQWRRPDRASRSSSAPACRSQAEVNETVCQGGWSAKSVR